MLFPILKDRYNSIIADLGLDLDLSEAFEKIRLAVLHSSGRDYVASRGEYLNAMILAKYLGFSFIDAKKVVLFNEDGTFNSEKTNDVMRDATKGSVFEKTGKGYINGAANSSNLSKIVFSIDGGKGVGYGWSVDNAMIVNYMSAHDNNTLWDKLLLSNPNASDDARNKMNNLGAAILMISKGTPFWQAGEEMLRTKDGDENSYKSSDEINNIDWSVLSEDSREYKTMLYYKGLIEMRKTYSIFSDVNTIVDYEALGNGMAIIRFPTTTALRRWLY